MIIARLSVIREDRQAEERNYRSMSALNDGKNGAIALSGSGLGWIMVVGTVAGMILGLFVRNAVRRP